MPCNGNNSSKQTIRTTTVLFGYKSFVMCADDVYLYFVDPYCGFKYSGENKASNNLYARSVIDCVSEIDEWSDKEVFFDKWFSSLSLIKVLKDQGIRATDTVRADKLGSLKINKSDVKKQEQGTINTLYEKTGIFFVNWNDNSPVTVISNTYTDVPHGSVKQWNPGNKAYIKLDHPNCITEYKKPIGGVHSLDYMTGVYRIDVHGKKWYWPHHISTIDVLKRATFTVLKLPSPN